MRLFVAAYLDKESIKKVMHFQQVLKKKINAKFVKEDQLHITLLFLGNQDSKTIHNVESWLEQISKESFTISLENVNIFRDTLVLTLKPHSYLESLHLSLKQSVNEFLKKPIRFYTPHITLARKVKDKKLVSLDIKSLPYLRVNELALVKSTLEKTGAKHEKIKRLPLINH